MAVLFALFPSAAFADSYAPTTLTPVQVLQHARDARGEMTDGSYVEVDRDSGGGMDNTITTYSSGDDWRSTETGGGYTTSSGSYQGQRWHVNENGIVVLESNFHAKVDPNVLAWQHPDDPKYNVRTLGLTQTQPQEIVLEANPPDGIDEYRYYDAKTFLLDRVVRFERDRYRHVTEYGDYRRVFGAMMAFKQQYSDGRPQNDETTTVVSFEQAPAGTSLTIPASTPLYSLYGNGAVNIPASFTDDGIVVHANVNGRGLDFILDSGADGLYIDPGVVHQLGLTTYGKTSVTIGGGDVDEGNVRIPQMSIGPLNMRNVVFNTSPMDEQAGSSRVVGLIGFDFIASGVIAIDFKAKTVKAYPRAGFDPQAMGLFPVPVQIDDGVARASAWMEQVKGAFLVDTGAFAMMAYRDYVDKLKFAPIESNDERFETVGGGMNAQLRNVTDFVFGGIEFRSAEVLTPTGSTFDEPDYDGIIGRDALSDYVVYFDYPDHLIYVKYNAGN